jgi:hypothetical protein
MLRSRSLTLALAVTVASATASRPVFAQVVNATELKAHMDQADRAAKAKDWEKALTDYRAAFDAGRSEAALAGIAGALYELKRTADAFEAYDDLLRSFGEGMSKARKAQAEARHKELAARTGTIAVRVSEPGAEVAIDDKLLGTAPVPAKPVAAGAHKVRVTRAGFAPFEQTTSVAAGAAVAVDVSLSREARRGRLSVKEKDGKPTRVVIDGLDVGAAPWEGDVDPGAHDVLLRSSAAASTPQRVEVQAGKASSIELAAVAALSHLEITTSDPHAILFLDGKALAEGSFKGDVAPGDHMLAVTKEGFERYEKRLSLAPQGTEAIDVKLQKAGTPAASGVEPARGGGGLYGGFGLLGIGLSGGTGNELDTRCTELGATSCDRPMPLGGGLFGYFGYAFDPVGFELMAGGEFDQNRPTAHFAGDSGASYGNPAVNGPARTEEFTFLRAGGFGAVRVRLNIDSTKFRVSVAGGVGLAMKHVVLVERTATSLDGALKDVYAPPGQTYVSPAVNVDLSAQWRITPATALALGLFAWIESASFTDVRAPGDLNRYMGGATGRAAIVTPPYQLASGAQVFLGPYLGMQFGP